MCESGLAGQRHRLGRRRLRGISNEDSRRDYPQSSEKTSLFDHSNTHNTITQPPLRPTHKRPQAQIRAHKFPLSADSDRPTARFIDFEKVP
jgi:hypothetical protein